MDELVILIDVDDTLIDSAALRRRLDEAIGGSGGAEAVSRFWRAYDEVRAERGYADVTAAIGRAGGDVEALRAAVAGVDFGACVHPGALKAVHHLGSLGTAAILTDGDESYQRHKVASAGIEAAVGGRVMVCEHKERELDEVRRRYPARHYALLDDRPRILAAAKRAMGTRLTTVLVRQGRYGIASAENGDPAPDIELGAIDEASTLRAEQLLAPAREA